MSTARQLITTRLALGRESERLIDLGARITEASAHYCVVLADESQRFMGLVRLAEIAIRTNPSNRILADLISKVQPLVVAPNEPAHHIVSLFRQHQIGEAVVLEPDGSFVGLITALSVLEWCDEERQRVETARRTQIRYLELATASGGVGIFRWDPVEAYFTCENEQMNDLLGNRLPTSPTRRFSLRDVFGPDESIFHQAVQRAIVWGGVFSCECQVQRLDTATSRRVRIVGAVVTSQGVSHVWAAAAEISSNEDATRGLPEPSDPSSVLSRGRLFRLLSHELRTPLSPVLLIAGRAAEDDTISEEVRQSFRVIGDLIMEEARMIDELLQQKELTEHTLALDLSYVSLDSFLGELLERTKARLSSKKINLIYRPLSPDVQLAIDRPRLQTAFEHILHNAWKYTPAEGHLHIAVSKDAKSGLITVNFSDDGVGLTDRELRVAFSPFARGDHQEYAFSGLGLGLPIAQGIVALHGGSIQARSEGRHQGATFTISLPQEPPGYMRR